VVGSEVASERVGAPARDGELPGGEGMVGELASTLWLPNASESEGELRIAILARSAMACEAGGTKASSAVASSAAFAYRWAGSLARQRSRMASSPSGRSLRSWVIGR
jgi:hypothetical protein